MKKNQGFAISGVLYPILILVVFLIVELLTVLGSRKVVLDQNNKKLLETINNENKVYTNEELSDLITEQAKKIAELEGNLLNKTYPIGSIYVSIKNTNPAEIFGGTWVSFGSGKTLVGVSTSDTNYNTVEKTGGSASQSIKLSTDNLPSHSHSIPALSGTAARAGAHIHAIDAIGKDYTVGNTGGTGTSGINAGPSSWSGANTYSNANWNRAGYQARENGAHTHSVTTTANTSGATGKTTAFTVSHIQPYITVYMWKRTA